jgi:hypothetical protein
MKKIGAAALVGLILIAATTVPSDARGRGGHSHGHRGHQFHRGHHGHHGHHHRHGHHGHFGRWGWWGPGAVIGGLALGAALALPSAAYAYPPATAPAPVVYEQAPASPPLVQREVVHPHGKYVLYGDGVSQPWQWVWVPAPGPPASPPAAR